MANIDSKLGTIGRKHDPYATKTITFTATDGKVIEYYQDGLDSARISVNGKVVILATVFDPSYFASQWGGGLAKSLGELGITAGAFALNLWLRRSGTRE